MSFHESDTKTFFDDNINLYLTILGRKYIYIDVSTVCIKGKFCHWFKNTLNEIVSLLIFVCLTFSSIAVYAIVVRGQSRYEY